MASSALMSAAPLSFESSSEDSLSSAERLFFASSSSPPLRPSYRTPPRVPEGTSWRRSTNRNASHAGTSHSSPVSSRRFGSPLRLSQATPPRRSRLAELQSFATPPTRESQLRARLEPSAASAPLLGLAEPVTIVDDEFGGALFGWTNVPRQSSAKGMSGMAGLRNSALHDLGALGEGITRSRSTPPFSQPQHHEGRQGYVRTPSPRPRRPSAASRLVTPPSRVFATSARASNGLGLGLGFELELEQDSPDTDRPAMPSLAQDSPNRRQGPVTRSMTSSGASVLGLAPSPSGLVATPPKRKTVNRTSSTESGGVASLKPALKAPKTGRGSQASPSRAKSSLAPAFDDGKAGLVQCAPTGETITGVPAYRRVTSSNATPPASSSRSKARPAGGSLSSRGTSKTSRRFDHILSSDEASSSTPRKAKAASITQSTPSGLGILGADEVESPGSTCSAPSLDGSPTSTSSVPSIVITPPAALSLAEASRSAYMAQQPPVTPTPEPQQRYSGTVLRYDDGSTAGFNVSPPQPFTAPDQFASPAFAAVSPTQSDVSVSPGHTPSPSSVANFPSPSPPSPSLWFEGQDEEASADTRAWSGATKGMDTDLLAFLEACTDDEARTKATDFLASMRFRLTLARNTCPTAPGGANSKDNKTPFDCCRWVRGAARAYLHATPAYVDGRGEQTDLLDAAMAKHMEHIVTGMMAMMADSLNGTVPPHEMPLWLADLCAAILSELKRLDDGFAALPTLGNSARPQPAERQESAKPQDDDVVVQSLGHMLLGSPAKLKGRDSLVDATPTPASCDSFEPAAVRSPPRKKLSTLFLDALFFEIDSALSFGAIVREQSLRLAVPVPVKKPKRRASKSGKGGKSRKSSGISKAELEAELAQSARQAPSDLTLASKGEISAEELRSRERRKAALGQAKDCFTSLNTIRFVGELYRVGILPLPKLQAWLERLVFDTVYPGVPSAFELEATCALVLTVGPTLELQARENSNKAVTSSETEAESTPLEAFRQDAAPQTPSSTAASAKLTTPTSESTSSVKHLSPPTQTPRSDGAPANHWIHCSPSAARRMHARCSSLSPAQGVFDSPRPASPDASSRLSSLGHVNAPAPSTSSSSASSEPVTLSVPHFGAAQKTLDSTMARLQEVLEIHEIHDDARMWIMGVIGFRGAGWKSPKKVDEMALPEA